MRASRATVCAPPNQTGRITRSAGAPGRPRLRPRHEAEGLIYCVVRCRPDNSIHAAHNPSLARTDGPEPLVCDLRRSPGPRSATDAAGNAVPEGQRSGMRSAVESRAHAEGAVAAAAGARSQVALARRRGIQRHHRGMEQRRFRRRPTTTSSTTAWATITFFSRARRSWARQSRQWRYRISSTSTLCAGAAARSMARRSSTLPIRWSDGPSANPNDRIPVSA